MFVSVPQTAENLLNRSQTQRRAEINLKKLQVSKGQTQSTSVKSPVIFRPSTYFSDGTMVKKLSKLCVETIACNLDAIPNAHKALAPPLKVEVLRWLGDHDRLEKSYVPFVHKHIVSSKLKTLDLYRCNQVDDEFLKRVASSGCQLRSLKIVGCCEVTDAGFKAMTRGQRELECVELTKMPALSDKGLAELQSPRVWRVDLNSSSKITDVGIERLVRANPTIQEIVLSYAKLITEKAYPVIASVLQRNLRELVAHQCRNVTDAALVALGRCCPQLRSLNIHGSSSITSAGLLELCAGCPELRDIDLGYCNKLTSQSSAAALSALPVNLTKLSLCGVLIEHELSLVGAVMRLRKLKSLRLSGVSAVNYHTVEEMLHEIGDHLEELDVSGPLVSLDDECLRAVSKHCKNLTMLSLQLSKEITGMTLLPLLEDPERASKLEVLNLSCRKMESSVIRAVVENCCNVTRLDFSGLPFIDDEILTQLSVRCPKVTHIYLKGCRQITDAGICQLAYRLPLRLASLSGLQHVTDKSILALANACPDLSCLYISGCYQVSACAVKYLKDCCNGRVFYKHLIPNADPNRLMAKNLDTGEFCRVDNLPFDQL